MSATIARAAWLKDPKLQQLLALLNAYGGEARIVGGAVRNALLGEPIADVDIATTNLPNETVRRAEAAGFRAIPTGAEHGTITVISDGKQFEVTSLRADVETDGRRAKVVFGRDWKLDAERRDFTINALYAKADGSVIDLVGGLADLESRTLRFIGDAETRISEDYLRILRFFRFFAWYGKSRPDAEGFKACSRLKKGLDVLSAERVWFEVKRLLSAPDPSRALFWMRKASVLTAALPESEKWGIDAIHALIRAENDLGWNADPLLRLASIVPPDAAHMKTLGERLRLSNVETDRLVQWAVSEKIEPTVTEGELAKRLYRGNVEAVSDRLRLDLASARGRVERDEKARIQAGDYFHLLTFVGKWQKPEFPLRGGDFEALCVEGALLGSLLKVLEAEWIESGFLLERDALLKRAAERLKA